MIIDTDYITWLPIGSWCVENAGLQENDLAVGGHPILNQICRTSNMAHVCKESYHNSIIYLELEAIQIFNPTYIDKEIDNDFFYETAFVNGNLNDLRLDRKAQFQRTMLS